MSEESGRTGEWNDDSIIVVMDPLDGSTNASRRVPWYATALAAIDASGHRASLVANQFTNTDRWTATTGGGAFHNGVRISPSDCERLSDAVVGVSGVQEASGVGAVSCSRCSCAGYLHGRARNARWLGGHGNAWCVGLSRKCSHLSRSRSRGWRGAGPRSDRYRARRATLTSGSGNSAVARCAA